MTEEKPRNNPAAPRAPAVPASRPRLPSSSPGIAAVKQPPTPLRVPGTSGAGISPRPPSVTAADSTGPMPAIDASHGPMPQIAIEAKLADFTAWRRDADRKISRLEGEISDLRTNLAVALAAQAANAGGAGAPKLDRSRDETAPILPEFKALAENPAVWSTVAAGLAPTAAITAPAPPAVGSTSGTDSSPAPAAAPLPGRVPSPSSPSVVVAPDSAPPVRVVAIASTTRAPHVQYDLQMRPGESIDLPGALDGERRKRVVGWLFVALVLAGMAALVISSLASQR